NHLALGEVLEADVVHVEQPLVVLRLDGVALGRFRCGGFGGGSFLRGGGLARDGGDGAVRLLDFRHAAWVSPPEFGDFDRTRWPATARPVRRGSNSRC